MQHLKAIACILVFVMGCKVKNESRVQINIKQSYGRKVYLQQVPFLNESAAVIDSAVVKSKDDDIKFNLPQGEERVYRIKISDSNVDIYFVNDAPDIHISVALLKPNDYIISNSPANASLQAFYKQQKLLAEKIREDERKIDSFKATHHNADNLQVDVNKLQKLFYQRYIAYADTVKSPAAFILVYNNVDFGKQYKDQKEFILRAAKRFPSYSPIQQLRDKTLAYLKIFEEEFEIGNKLPYISLPDQSGTLFSTKAFDGKYCLINFWSSWCDICFPFNAAIKKVNRKFKSDKFQAVNIAIDSETDLWKRVIEQQRLNWTQLIDTAMWEGPAIRTFKIDSIPFNFLINPSGIIIKKAIPSDSLEYYLTKMIK